MQDGDDDAHRPRRTRRRAGADDAPGTPDGSPQPPAAGPVPPTGVRRVRGGRVPRHPGGPAPAGPPTGPRVPPAGRATPVPPGPPTGPRPGGAGSEAPDPRSAGPAIPDPGTRGPSGPGTGTGGDRRSRDLHDSGPHRNDQPGPHSNDQRSPHGNDQPGPHGGDQHTGGRHDSGSRRRPTAPDPTAAKDGTDPTRGAADSRDTQIAAVPRRLRRRYADDVPDTPADDAPTDGPAADPTEDPTAEPAERSAEQPTGKPTGKPAAAPSSRQRWIRIGAAAAAALVLVTTAFGFAGRGAIHDGVRPTAALAPDSDAVLDAATQTGDRNILVLALQADRADSPESARTDTAVLVHQPAGGGQPVTLSLPATLEVARPPCARWDPATGAYGDTVPAESRTAFATAYDVGGPACTVGVVQQLTGIPMSGFVALDLARTPELVDAVGGIRVCTERPVVDPVLGPVVEGSGSVPLDGPVAARFASAAATGDSSPANRVQRQQRVLAAALGDALSTTSLLTPGAPGRAADGVSAALVADGVDAGEILTLARGLSRAGTAGDGSTPLFLGLPVSEVPNTRGHLELQRSEARALFAALRKHEPLPESATAPAARSAAAPAGAGTVVDLVDATGTPGSVDQVAENLRERGYEIGAISTGAPAEGAMVHYSPDNTDAAGTLVGALPGARPAPDPTGSGRLELVVGATGAAPVQAVPADDADCS
ncbi:MULTISPECIES: LCP family protein [Pseudonocardia]|uniref:Transcriptional regulator LytR n=2 Tax=Pseudonocardia TaxID=1847 RepID=A0A1Y2MX37_PSEAH|nr:MULTISPECIES: LCP family protein [Pseudonocardia]OSY39387.1 Transcriptional regulator LytR [Pseudonocardia autotrophica]TDN75375.1 LytR family transcriptional attenuator [Pseudonocardia autotrophica]BBF99321.1 hypothetical protein Pdca_05310 [Pseudonocardia autotrophica]GEC28663.1 hypothetical protein PSA01_56920 [Pseudonocardia saturnea]